MNKYNTLAKTGLMLAAMFGVCTMPALVFANENTEIRTEVREERSGKEFRREMDGNMDLESGEKPERPSREEGEAGFQNKGNRNQEKGNTDTETGATSEKPAGKDGENNTAGETAGRKGGMKKGRKGQKQDGAVTEDGEESRPARKNKDEMTGEDNQKPEKEMKENGQEENSEKSQRKDASSSQKSAEQKGTPSLPQA